MLLGFRALVLFAFLIRSVSVTSREACPSPCECKWKKGKETVSCPNDNFSIIPRMEKHSGTQVLDFPGNPLKILRNDIFIDKNLLNLQELYLSSCSIGKIEPNAFRDLINLVRLDLSKNSIVSVPEKSLNSVTQLRELSISGNPIRKIKNYAFSALSQLVKLEISDCQLTWIEPYAFNGLETLRRLKIDGNRLAELNPAVWYPLRNSLYGIDLHSNPWNCSCALRPTLEWIRTANVPPSIPPVCASPSRLRHKSWSSLRERDFACSPVIVLLASSRSDNVTLTCRIRGDPLVDVNWFWEGSPVDLAGDLELGTYRCSGKNAAGHVEESIRLTDAHSILGGTPVTTLRKRSSRDNFYFILVSLSVGSLLFVCLFGACCIYGVHQRSRPMPEMAKTTVTYTNGSAATNGHTHKTSQTLLQQQQANSIELQNMLKTSTTTTRSSKEDESCRVSPDLIKYNEGYEDNEKSLLDPSLPKSSNDCYVEIEPVMKSELLATARETEIRGLAENEGEDQHLLGNLQSPHRSHTLDGRRSSGSNSYNEDSNHSPRRYSVTEDIGHPKIKTFLKEYSQLQSQLNRLREARSESLGTSLLCNSSQNSPDLRYNYSSNKRVQVVHCGKISSSKDYFIEEEEYEA
ncbi:unnamed protein product [Lepeophtheirus salmonis]|uniref:(salmon louse) hypothetical protein n=1 Tax=Lepeophtheirus salmonis TaxID=72036 RepID=A0A7R8D344_LEPSM|nr:unnamed protein product [Lepeophtheirus salmonis]CAF3013060.1 unnamed protein product [Lepeophtheirus salmonis]